MSIKFVVLKTAHDNKLVKGLAITNDWVLDIPTSRLKKGVQYNLNVFKNNQHVRGGKKFISLGRTGSTIDLKRLQHGKTYTFVV